MTTLTYEYENIRFTCSPMGNRPNHYVVNATRISDGHSLHTYGGKRRGIDQTFFTSDQPPTQAYFERVCHYQILTAIGNFEPEPVLCYACHATLEADDDSDYQFDNALWIDFKGGYGMFIDQIGNQPGPYPKKGEHEVVICHECAHKLCETVPWVERLLEPLKSHSHPVDKIADLVAQGHQGWDLTQYHDGTTAIPDHKDQT